MKKTLLFSFFLFSIFSIAQQWNPVGPDDSTIFGNQYGGIFLGELDLQFDSSGIPHVSTSRSILRFDGTDWQQLGGEDFAPAGSESYSFVINDQDEIYIVFTDKADDRKVAVKKFDGNNWQNVGSTGLSTGSGIHVSIALDSFGTPYIIYSDGGNGDIATVQKFNGNSWEVVGNSSVSSGRAFYNEIRFDSNDVPYIAFRDAVTGNRANVKKFNGIDWEFVGPPGFSAGRAAYISFEIDADDIPFIAYRDSGNGDSITVQKFNGSAWVSVGSPGFNGGLASFPHMAFDSSGNLYVVYQDFIDNQGFSTIQRFNGTDWELFGDRAFRSNISSKLAFQPSTDILYSYSGRNLIRYINNQWESLGNKGISDFQPNNFDLASGFNATYISYFEDFEEDEFFIKKLNGNSWQDVSTSGLYDADLAFLSGETQTYLESEIAVSPSGELHIAYVVRFSNTFNDFIYIKKFNGTSWSFVGQQPEAVVRPQNLRLLFDSAGVPFISYVEKEEGNISPDELRIKKLQNNGWVDLPATGSGVVGEYDIVFSPNHQMTSYSPYIVYKDNEFLGAFTAKVYNGTDWVQISDLSAATPSGSTPQVVVNSSQDVFVLYYDQQNSIPKVLEGDFSTAWSLVSDLNAYETETYPREMLLDSNENPVALFRAGSNVFAQRYESNSWSDIGSRTGIYSNSPVGSAAFGPNDLLYYTHANRYAFVKSLSLAPLPPSNPPSIASFLVGTQSGVIDGTSITVTVPIGTDLADVRPIIITSVPANVSPASGTAVDFSNGPVTYTVTALDGTTQTQYQVSLVLPQRPFVTTWKTDNPGVSANNQITIPTGNGQVYNYSVDWGDGSKSSNLTGNATHTYSSPGIYQVSISGDFPWILFGTSNGADKEKLLSIDQWGDIEWSSFEASFNGCINLDVLATDVPDLTQVTNMRAMFFSCSNLQSNPSFNSWDVSNVENMNSMFMSATNFNAPLINWDLASANNIESMFRFATSFNQDLNDWRFPNVRFMYAIFEGASSFNGNISGWDLSAVSSTDFMFQNATSFNQDISAWDTAAVVNMEYMFFGATAFNQNIGNWNVASVRTMTRMFENNTVFNQDISGWDVGEVISFSGMFSGATAFDQDLGGWDISSIVNLSTMFNNAGLSRENYDSTLEGWATLDTAGGETQIPTGLNFDGGNSQYCFSETFRTSLIDNFGWSISDGGQTADCDNIAPIITCSADVESVIPHTDTSVVLTLTNPTATDNISTVFTFQGTRSDGLTLAEPFPLGDTTVSWTAMDEAGNVSSSCDQQINVVQTHTPPTGVLPWSENFETDLSDGSTEDSGSTAWTTTINQGSLETANGKLEIKSVEGGSLAFFYSEVLDITNYTDVSINMEVSDLDQNQKENSDFLKAYYVLDGGPQVQFGGVNNDINPQTFQVQNLNGSSLQLIIEIKVSWFNEAFTVDNILIDGTSTGPVAVTGVNVSPPSVTLTEGETRILNAEVLPANATDKTVSWMSSDEAIATVSTTGEVSAVAAGTATITATTTDGGFMGSSSITVEEIVPIPVTGVSLSPMIATAFLGGSPINLVATVSPANADNPSVTWSSSDTNIATVSETGVVSAVAVGTAIITVTTIDGEFTASSTISVQGAPASDLPWTETFDDLSPGTTLDDGITAWTTSVDQGTLEVANGKLEMKSVEGGSLAFFYSEVLDISTHADVSISMEVSDLDQNSKEVSDYLKAYYILDGGAQVQFGSVNNDIVAQTFSVANLNGSSLQLVVEIKVSWFNEAYTIDNINIDGTSIGPVAVTGVSVNPLSVSLFEGENTALNAIVQPSDATDKSVVWSSSDEGVATVSPTGVVTAVSVGSTSITATTTDGGFMASSSVSVDEVVPIGVTGVSVSPMSATAYLGGAPVNLNATILPANADDLSVSWVSSNTAVATVNQSGQVTAIAVGSATITVTTTDGGFTASSTITVAEAPASELPWEENFDDLAEGVTMDGGLTAWTTSLDQGSLEVSNGKLEMKSVEGGSLAYFFSEVIDISTHRDVSISLEVSDLDQNQKENSDYLKAYYVLDGGGQVQFGGVNNDINPQTFSVNDLNGSTLQLVVEIKVSWFNEAFTIDNINIDGTSVGPVAVTGITVTPPTVTATLGESPVSLNATVLPADATNKNVTWSSTDTSVGTVDPNGVVTGLSAGSTTVIATTQDGGFMASSRVTFEEPQPIHPSSAPLPPVEADEDVISIYSDTYVDNPRLGFDFYGTATFQEIDLQGNKVLRYTFADQGGGNFQVIELGLENQINLMSAGMTNFRFDLWFSNQVLADTRALFKLVDIGGSVSEAVITIDDSSSPAIEQGRWLRFDFTLDELANLGLAAKSNIQQLVVDLINSGEVYIDNIYFYKPPAVPEGALPWIEDFETDLSAGSTLDTGDTGWSTTIDQGSLETNNGKLEMQSVEGGSLAFMTTEVIDISDYVDVSISLDVSDLDQNQKENSDYIRAYYVLDGGAQILFGNLRNDINPTTFSVANLNGSTLQVVVEIKVSWFNESFTVDNIVVDGTSNIPSLSARITPVVITKLTPNPAQDLVTISVNMEQKVSGVQIFDFSGRLVRDFDARNFGEPAGNVQIDLNGLEQGMYNLSLKTLDGIVITKQLLVR